MSRETESPADDEPSSPASESNKARQKRSRQNITHPIQFTDKSLEDTYNQKRNIPKSNRKSELRRLH